MNSINLLRIVDKETSTICSWCSHIKCYKTANKSYKVGIYGVGWSVKEAMSGKAFYFKAILLALFTFCIIVIGAASQQQIDIENNDNLSFQLKHVIAPNVETTHILLQVMRRQAEDKQPFAYQVLDHVVAQQHSAHELENVFTQILNDNWNNSQLLLEIADVSKELSVKATIFEILYQALQPTKKIYNPFELMQLYRAIDSIAFTMCRNNIGNGETEQCIRIADVQMRLRDALTSRSAQLLEALVHNLNHTNILQRLLHELSNLEDQIYIETLAQMYDAVQDLVPMEQVAAVIGNLSISTKQSVAANLQLLNRSPIAADHNLPSVGNATRSILIGNLKDLLNQPDFDKLEPQWRSSVYDFLPISIRNLYVASKVCIRNATNAARYLYECPETYLMCINDQNSKQAAFVVERNTVEGGAAFRSLHWTNRYIRLEEGVVKTTSLPENRTLSAHFTKNVYSKLGAQHWLVEWRGENVALLDASLAFYLCAGDSLEWSGEQHAYTRRAANFSSFQQECEWFIEDCSTL